MLDPARSPGVAAPRYLLIRRLRDSHVIVQEQLPGRRRKPWMAHWCAS